jgi:uncharacterized membrane protein
MMATAMSANVFFWIIPGQKKVIAQMKAGQPVEAIHGQRAKQRSVHNTYFTLPVLIAMLSNHYGWLYQGRHNWLVLVLLMLAGALIRHSFVVRHKALAMGRRVPWEYAVGGTAVLLGLAIWLAPAPQPATAALPPPTLAQVKAVVDQRCTLCHNAAGAAEERGAAHARADPPARAGDVPAGGGAQGHAAEQRHADHRRRARALQALVRGRRAGKLSARAAAAR